jgi:hypothetical protein
MSLHGGLCYRERQAPPPASPCQLCVGSAATKQWSFLDIQTCARGPKPHVSEIFSSRCPTEGGIVVLAACEERCRPTANQTAWEPNTTPQAHPCKRAVSLRTPAKCNVRPTGDPRGRALFVTLTSVACSRTARPASFAATREMHHLQHALSLRSSTSSARPRYAALRVLSGTRLPMCGFVSFPRTFEHHPPPTLDCGLDFVHAGQTLGGRAAVSCVQQLRLGLHSGLSAPLCRGVVMPWHRSRRLCAPACSRVSTPAARQQSRRQLYFGGISGLTVEACKSRNPYRQNQIAARRR